MGDTLHSIVALSIIPRDLHRRGRNSGARVRDAQYPAVILFLCADNCSIFSIGRKERERPSFSIIFHRCKMCDINL